MIADFVNRLFISTLFCFVNVFKASKFIVFLLFGLQNEDVHFRHILFQKKARTTRIHTRKAVSQSICQISFFTKKYATIWPSI